MFYCYIIVSYLRIAGSELDISKPLSTNITIRVHYKSGKWHNRHGIYTHMNF